MVAAGAQDGSSARQRLLGRRRPDLGMFEPDAGTVVVVPSLSVSQEELRGITGIQFYEERLLCFLLTLRRPAVRVVYLTSLPVDPAIVSYYLDFLPVPRDARRRLLLLALDDPSRRPLSAKLLERPEVLDEVRAFAGPDAWLVPFAVTGMERDLAERIGVPIYGPHPDFAPLGTKSGSKRVARQAGVPVLDGQEGLYSLADVRGALADLTARLGPDTAHAMVKLDDSYSGLGNAIVDVTSPELAVPHAPTRFCAADESWSTYAGKIAMRGAIVEELLRAPEVFSPSALLRITPAGGCAVAATHDQILGGPDNQMYLGCRFPADARYRAAVSDCAERVAKVLAARGVIGLFGIDFLVVPSPAGFRVLLCEINLRLGGTTHPFGMAMLATGASYDPMTGQLLVGGTARCYLATDNLTSAALIGRRPADVVETLRGSGLAFDPRTGTGVALHMLGAVPAHGKMGLTCIGGSPREAAELYEVALDLFRAT